MSSKLISNNCDFDRLYVECECKSELLYLDRLHFNELVLGCISSNIEHTELADKEFLFKDLKQFSDFCTLCSMILDGRKNSFYLEADAARLSVEHHLQSSMYSISMHLLQGSTCIYEIYMKENVFKLFVKEINELKLVVMDEACDLKIGDKVKVLRKQEMVPKFIDEIGRYHFSLGDGSDIVFNGAMEEYCGMEAKIIHINPFIDMNGQVNCTFTLSPAISDVIDPYRVSLYTFTLDMVEVIE